MPCLCLYNSECHLSTADWGERVEKCGIKVIHVMLTFLDRGWIKINSVDVIEQKLWKTGNPTKAIGEGKQQKKLEITSKPGSQQSVVIFEEKIFSSSFSRLLSLDRPLSRHEMMWKAACNQNYKAPENYRQRLCIIHFHFATLNVAGPKESVREEIEGEILNSSKWAKFNGWTNRPHVWFSYLALEILFDDFVFRVAFKRRWASPRCF